MLYGKCFRLLRENAKTFPELDQPIVGKCTTGPVLSGLAETRELFNFRDTISRFNYFSFFEKVGPVLNLSLIVYAATIGVEGLFERFRDAFIDSAIFSISAFSRDPLRVISSPPSSHCNIFRVPY